MRKIKVNLTKYVATEGGLRYCPTVITSNGCIASEYRSKYGPGAAPTTEIDLLIAPGFAFANPPIECDCHIASTD